MARIRTIKPEFWEDETIASLSRDARLLFIATFNIADDEGLLRWAAPFIKAQAFIYDDDISVEDAQALMDELTAAELIYPYVGGKARQRLAIIINFRKHQKINRPQPSKLPAPSLMSPEIRQMYGRRDGWICHLCNGPINERPSTDERFNLSIDHVKPRSLGGEDYPSNLRAAHQSCNKARKNSLLSTGDEPGMQTLEEPPRERVQRSVKRSVNTTVNDAPKVADELTGGREGKGKERKGSSAASAGAAAPSAGTVVGVWVEAMNANGVEPSQGQRNQVGKLAKELLARNDPQRVLAAARQAGAKGFATIDRELTAMAGRPLRSVSNMRSPWLPAHYDDDGVIRDPKTGVAIER